MDGMAASAPAGVRRRRRDDGPAALAGLDGPGLLLDPSLRALRWNAAAADMLGRPWSQDAAPVPVARLLAHSAAVLQVRRLSGRRWLGTLDSPALGGEPVWWRDPLTGLADRRCLFAALEQVFARPDAEAELLLLDLDRFKQVNDTLGHPIGDALLRCAADRLRRAARAEDVVARLGGDEFAVLLAQRGAGVALAERLVDLLGRPYLLGGQLASVGASIGLASAPEHGGDAASLMRSADLALYAAKDAGRRTVRAFTPALAERAQARARQELELRRALPLQQFELHYQPQLDLRRNALVGFEALLRWRRSDGRLMPPDSFVPLAEELGLIVGIGAWVLRTACREAAAWPRQASVSVNVSPRQLDDGEALVASVVAALAESGLAPARLELEITESALLRHDGATLGTLHALRALGVSISMDDFGTGYSSLSQLRSFPFTKVKIDRSFVRDIETSGDAVAVVRAIAALSLSLGMQTIAEGVETRGQASIVRDEGCSAFQGFLLSRPVPAAQVAGLIQAHEAASGAPDQSEAGS